MFLFLTISDIDYDFDSHDEDESEEDVLVPNVRTLTSPSASGRVPLSIIWIYYEKNKPNIGRCNIFKKN